MKQKSALPIIILVFFTVHLIAALTATSLAQRRARHKEHRRSSIVARLERTIDCPLTMSWGFSAPRSAGATSATPGGAPHYTALFERTLIEPTVVRCDYGVPSGAEHGERLQLTYELGRSLTCRANGRKITCQPGEFASKR